MAGTMGEGASNSRRRVKYLSKNHNRGERTMEEKITGGGCGRQGVNSFVA